MEKLIGIYQRITNLLVLLMVAFSYGVGISQGEKNVKNDTAKKYQTKIDSFTQVIKEQNAKIELLKELNNNQ